MNFNRLKRLPWDGSTDISSEIQKYLDKPSKVPKKLPKGIARCDKTIYLPEGVTYGCGPESTIFDFSGAAQQDLDNGDCLATKQADIQEVAEITTDIQAGDRYINVSNDSLKAGDVFYIWNPNEFSYSGWRANYHAGEICVALSVDGTEIQLLTPTFSNYTSESKIYKPSKTNHVTLRDFAVRGLADTDSYTYALHLYDCVGASVENVHSTGGTHSGMLFKRCLNTNVNNCVAEDNYVLGNNDYGICWSNSQNAKIFGGHFGAARHGAAAGGGSSVPGAIPCRLIDYFGATISTNGTTTASDFHGNVANSSFQGCTIMGSAGIAGDNNKIVNCNIIGPQTSQAAIYFSELLSGNHKIADNYIEAFNPATNRGCFIDCGGNSSALNQKTIGDGTIIIHNNNMVYKGETSVVDGIRIYNRGSEAKLNIDCSKNIMSEGDSDIQRSLVIRKYSGASFNQKVVEPNLFDGTTQIYSGA